MANPADDLTLELPLGSGQYLYNFTVDWGDGTTGEVTGFDDADKSHVYATAGEYTVVISGLMEAMTSNDHKHKLLRVPNLGHVAGKASGVHFKAVFS